MSEIASQITSLTIVYSTVYSVADQRKHQSYASLVFVRGIHRRPVNSPHKGPVTWKMFPFEDVFVRGIHRPQVNSRHKGQWRGALIFFICAWTNGWVNNRGAGNLRYHCAHYDVTVMTETIHITPVFIVRLIVAGGVDYDVTMTWKRFSNHRSLVRETVTGTGVGVSKPISPVPLFSNFFSFGKTYVNYWISRLYLTGGTAAWLRWHLWNMNVIQII